MYNNTSTGCGSYPMRRPEFHLGIDCYYANFQSRLRHWKRLKGIKDNQKLIRRIEAFEHVANWDDTECSVQASRYAKHLRRQGITVDTVSPLFALVRQATIRTLQMEPHGTQFQGAFALLQGVVAEMDTGEGKSMTAALAASVAALAGYPVHIITVNDYLAGRDAKEFSCFFQFFGLKVASIHNQLSPHERKAAYKADIVYCSNKEIVFDYLRDQLVLKSDVSEAGLRLEQISGRETRLASIVMRGLHYAIVDEADSVLIDEASMPLIISKGKENFHEQEIAAAALDIALNWNEGQEFTIRRETQEITLSKKGIHVALKQIPHRINEGLRKEDWLNLCKQAIRALYLLNRDIDYVIDNDSIVIVDKSTGRCMPDRQWQDGLHSLVEMKEGMTSSNSREIIAQTSYQRFFLRYHHLSGMTGTAQEVSRELLTVYGLPVVRIPRHRPDLKTSLPFRAFLEESKKLEAIVHEVRQLFDQEIPVLVGTSSIEQSEKISEMLADSQIPHEVINAKREAEEAGTIARAGEKGSVCVATNMAGRGTDIKLGIGVVEKGGLIVISAERNDSYRIDRQLYGRCGRQGDPGSFQQFACLQDRLVIEQMPGWARAVLALTLRSTPPLGRWLFDKSLYLVQKKLDRRSMRIRREILEYDEKLKYSIAFSGRHY